MMPPFDPTTDPAIARDDDQERIEPPIRFISEAEATDEDKVTFGDTLAIIAAVAVAQLVRLGIIFAAVGIIILAIFLGSKL